MLPTAVVVNGTLGGGGWFRRVREPRRIEEAASVPGPPLAFSVHFVPPPPTQRGTTDADPLLAGDAQSS